MDIVPEMAMVGGQRKISYPLVSFSLRLFCIIPTHERLGYFSLHPGLEDGEGAAWGVRDGEAVRLSQGREEEPRVQGRDGPREWHFVILFWTFLLFPVKWFPWHFLVAFKGGGGGEKGDFFFFALSSFFPFLLQSDLSGLPPKVNTPQSVINSARAEGCTFALRGGVYTDMCAYVLSQQLRPPWGKILPHQACERSPSLNELSPSKLPEAHSEARSGVSPHLSPCSSHPASDGSQTISNLSLVLRCPALLLTWRVIVKRPINFHLGPQQNIIRETF